MPSPKLRTFSIFALAGASVNVYADPEAGAAATAKLTLKAVSESDPSKSAVATVTVSKR